MEPRNLPRFAVYFLPDEDTQLAALGKAWLGRDMRTGRAENQPILPEISAERLSSLTESPRHYGFHATLKAPFRLKRGVLLPKLEARCEFFAKEMSPVQAPNLKVVRISGFLALVLSATCPELDILTAACIESLDDLRAPLEPNDLKKWQLQDLTERQIANLKRWGYPYVMEDFRFHMTLTEGLGEAAEAELLEEMARLHFAPVLKERLILDAISLVAQPDRDSPFRELARYPLGSV